MFAIFLVIHAILDFASCLGPLPDASQEGLLWPWKGYASVALFHFNVPEESTRATFEFASFQGMNHMRFILRLLLQTYSELF